MAKFGMVVCALYAVICVLSMVAAEYLSLTAGYTKELGGNALPPKSTPGEIDVSRIEV